MNTLFTVLTIIVGTLLDGQSRLPEPSAALQFFKAGSEKMAGYTITDGEGRFSYDIKDKGNYTLVYENVGRLRKTVDFAIADADTLDLGEILIEDDVETLKAGQVVAQRVLVKMEVDKITYDVEGDVDSKTSTVLDMLRKVPMVTVDGQDNITVNGSSSFQVYVDGKPNPMISQNASRIFKIMPASAVKNIEVNTNPGAKYDAEGVGGILNITTNKAVTGGQSVANGYYGSVSAQVSNRGFGGGVYGSMQQGKFALSLNLNSMVNNMDGTVVDVSRQQDNGYEMSSHTSSDSGMKALMSNVSMSYELDSLNLFSARFGLMGMDNENSGKLANTITLPGFGSLPYNGTVVSEMSGKNISAGIDYQHSWADAPGRTLTFSYQYNGSPKRLHTDNVFDSEIIPGLDLGQRNMNSLEKANTHTFQTDFTSPIGEKHTLSAGLKFIGRYNSSDVEDLASTMEYDYKDRIGAAYAEYAGKFDKFGVKAGTRYEHTWQTYSRDASDPINANYGNLVPSASIQWTPSMMVNLGLSYNMRISRPGISYLDPYVNDTDPTSLSYGNPELETEIGHTVNMVFNFMSPFLITNLTLREAWCNNGVSQYSFFDAANILHTTYGNIVKTRDSGLNGFVMVIPGKKTRIYMNGGLSYVDLRSEALGQSNYGWQHSLMVGVQQTLPWDLRASANIVKSGDNISIQGRTTGFSIGMVGLTKSFIDDRLSISMNFVSPFTKDGNMVISNTTVGNGFTTQMDTTVPVRQIMAHVSWTFGKQGNYRTKTVSRSINNDDILERSNQSESIGTTMMGLQ